MISIKLLNNCSKLANHLCRHHLTLQNTSSCLPRSTTIQRKYTNCANPKVESEKSLEAQFINDSDPFKSVNLNRGLTGVYDIGDLVDVLRVENGEDIFVADVPSHYNYVDHICIVTGKSVRHMFAVAQLVRQVYKKKRHSNDLIPVLEGKDSKDWMALDLGNIALHIFSRDARIKYDMDTLWAVGKEFDPQSNKTDPVVDMLERHSIYLADLKPAK